MIDFQNVSFSYGEESSGGGIRNVNLTINTGEFVYLRENPAVGNNDYPFGKRAGASLLRGQIRGRCPSGRKKRIRYAAL